MEMSHWICCFSQTKKNHIKTLKLQAWIYSHFSGGKIQTEREREADRRGSKVDFFLLINKYLRKQWRKTEMRGGAVYC